jgi:hypothetical protein
MTLPRGALWFCLGLAFVGLGTPASGWNHEVAPPPVAFEAGFDTRVREVTLHNLLDFDSTKDGGLASDAHLFRVRHRVWGQVKLRSGIRLRARFTTEWRKYLSPYVNPDKTEIILDHFYLDIPRLPWVPLSLRLGRQDIVRGEGFVLLEGGPLDGSRSIYQNALALSFDAHSLGYAGTRVELFAIRNLARDEFVVANDRERPLIESDETAFGLYVTTPELGYQTETYYFYKEEEPEGREHPNMRLHTFGTRVSGDLPWELKFAGEGAWQTGTHRDPNTNAFQADHRAYGGYVWLKRSFITPLQPWLKIGGVLLSGDDPWSQKVEGWVPLFARWPKWSELYIYSLIPESGRVGYWTNLLSLSAEMGLQLTQKTRLTYTFHSMHAPELADVSWCMCGLFGGGDERGQLHIWKLTAEFSKKVAWHFLVERLVPGDFYHAPRDDAYFVRWELMLNR